MKNCPQCALVNPPSAELCDCGYSFTTGRVGASPLSPKELAQRKPWRLDTQEILLLASMVILAALTALSDEWKSVPIVVFIVCGGVIQRSRKRWLAGGSQSRPERR